MKALRRGVFIVVTLLFLSIASASADSVVKSFNAKTKIDPGYTVALSADSSDSVELAPSKQPNKVFGVVIDQSSAAISFQRTGASTYVATSGSYPILVSLERGAINPGDYLAMSSIDGLVARATSSQDYSIGQAEQAFDGKSNVLFQSGGFGVGRVKAEVIPGRNPLAKGDVITRQLKLVADAIVGKQVTSARVYAAMAIFIITISLSAGLVWVGARTSLISIGRNPLSKHSIMQSLASVMVVAFLIFGGGLVSIYLLLRL